MIPKLQQDIDNIQRLYIEHKDALSDQQNKKLTIENETKELIEDLKRQYHAEREELLQKLESSQNQTQTLLANKQKLEKLELEHQDIMNLLNQTQEEKNIFIWTVIKFKK